jgi:hypothetical protein
VKVESGVVKVEGCLCVDGNCEREGGEGMWQELSRAAKPRIVSRSNAISTDRIKEPVLNLASDSSDVVWQICL